MAEASWEVAINSKWCKKCGLCVAFCPKKVLGEEMGAPKVLNESLCIGCLLCEMHCPDFAIAVKRRDSK